MAVRRSGIADRAVHRGADALVVLVVVQILLGIGVILLHVPRSLALLHQAGGLLLFTVTVFLTHRLLHVTSEQEFHRAHAQEVAFSRP
ncbi:MAG: COX15/CtaA family protein [Ardenticatenia bacterium]|nr:COX15/CtaA family protein [Ardenticatenia bacterium]